MTEFARGELRTTAILREHNRILLENGVSEEMVEVIADNAHYTVVKRAYMEATQKERYHNLLETRQ